MRKPVVKKIDTKKIEELEVILNKTNVTWRQRDDLIRKYAGGLCVCNAVPTNIVTWDISDPGIKAKRIERYCDNCIVSITNGKDQRLAVRDKKSRKRA